MIDDGSNRIGSVLARLEKGNGPDRDLDWDIAEALGASIRRVGRLGLNGRSAGSWRAFFPKSDPRKGSAIPYYTKDREKAKAKLRAVIASDENMAVKCRELAVELVDGIHGHTFEFSSHPHNHQAEYDLVEEKLLALVRAALNTSGGRDDG